MRGVSGWQRRVPRTSWVWSVVMLIIVAATFGSLAITASAQTSVAQACSWTSPQYLHGVLRVPVAKSSSNPTAASTYTHCQFSLWNPRKLGSGLLDITYSVGVLGTWRFGNLKQDDQQTGCRFSKVRGLGVTAEDELCRHNGAVQAQTFYVYAGANPPPGEGMDVITIAVSRTPTAQGGNTYRTIAHQGSRLEQILHHVLPRLPGKA